MIQKRQSVFNKIFNWNINLSMTNLFLLKFVTVLNFDVHKEIISGFSDKIDLDSFVKMFKISDISISKLRFWFSFFSQLKGWIFYDYIIMQFWRPSPTLHHCQFWVVVEFIAVSIWVFWFSQSGWTVHNNIISGTPDSVWSLSEICCKIKLLAFLV